MTRLRPLALPTVCGWTDANELTDFAFSSAFAWAASDDILSAIWPMKVPSTMRATAKIIMLRITPRLLLTSPAYLTIPGWKLGLTAPAKVAFSEKRVIEVLTQSGSTRLDAARRHRGCRIFWPGMTRIPPAQIGAHRGVAAAPETRQITLDLHRPMRWRQQLQHQRDFALGNRRMHVEAEQFLQS